MPRLASVFAQIVPYIYLALGLFAAGAVFGFLSPDLSLARLEDLKSFADSLRGLPAADLMVVIFLKNASATAMAIAFGALLGVFPVFGAFSNGVLLGGLMLVEPANLWRVIPHGVFELPAVFIAWGAGIWIGMWFRAGDPLVALRRRLLCAGYVFVVVVLPLLAIAAIIEGWMAAAIWQAPS